MSNGKYDNSFNSGIDKKDILNSEYKKYLLKPYEPFGEVINVEVDLSSFATKADLKNATGIDTSTLALKLNLANVKA